MKPLYFSDNTIKVRVILEMGDAGERHEINYAIPRFEASDLRRSRGPVDPMWMPEEMTKRDRRESWIRMVAGNLAHALTEHFEKI